VQIFIGIITVPCNLPQTCEVDVWLVSLETAPANETGDGHASVLSPDEKLRAARFRFDSDRSRWVCARTALRSILANYASLPAAELRFVLGLHGKPALATGSDIEFSLSHAGSWAMVAVARGVPVGIDIERIRDNVDMAALLRRLGVTDLQEGRTNLFRAWNRREAMTKAVGGALLDSPAGNFGICDLEAPEGYSAALALPEHTPRIRYCSTPVLQASTAKAP
jgi:4'-phosphopantetheinyl transferase